MSGARARRMSQSIRPCRSEVTGAASIVCYARSRRPRPSGQPPAVNPLLGAPWSGDAPPFVRLRSLAVDPEPAMIERRERHAILGRLLNRVHHAIGDRERL